MNIKKNKGITLITLVITIIVLLIISGISISVITGGESTIDKASKSKQSTEAKQEMDKLQRLVSNLSVKGVKNGNFSGSATVDEIKEAIAANFDNATITNNKFPLNVVINSNSFYISQDGEVSNPCYVEKKYIKSTGTQYIDTNYFSNSETRVKIKFSYIERNYDTYSNGMIFGSANNVNGKPGFSIGIALGDKIYYRNSDKDEAFKSSFSISNNEIYNIDIYKNNIYINDTLYTSQMELINDRQENSSYLFARHHPVDTGSLSGAYSKLIGIIYYCKIYEGDTLVRDFIPVISQESGHEKEPCLFDKIEGKFYYNQGEGTFETD